MHELAYVGLHLKTVGEQYTDTWQVAQVTGITPKSWTDVGPARRC